MEHSFNRAPSMNELHRRAFEDEGYRYLLTRSIKEDTPEHDEIIGWETCFVGGFFGYETPSSWPFRCVLVPLPDEMSGYSSWTVFLDTNPREAEYFPEWIAEAVANGKDERGA